jgi:hypothetical protein
MLLVFTACEKDELTTLDDLRSEAAMWKLDAYIYSPGGGLITQTLESERTLQFWEGKVRTNGSFCSLSGPVGAFEETDYDPVNFEITIGPCLIEGREETSDFSYQIDRDINYLYIYNARCVDGCALRYRKWEQ